MTHRRLPPTTRSARTPRHPGPARPLRLAGTALLAGITGAAALVPSAASAQTPAPARVETTAAAARAGAALPPGRPWAGQSDRWLVPHRVRAGETAGSLATRYHAWTAQLIRFNHLGRSGTVYVGQRITIPVVISAWKRAGGGSGGSSTGGSSGSGGSGGHSSGGWTHADLSRTQVAGVVRRTARRHAVPSALALAVAWQESGWQQRRISSTGAIGVMQVMPDTGRWMRAYAGRPLHLRDTHDNVLAGVLTLRVLRASTKHDRNAIGAYYQGLGAVQEHGLYTDTKAYVRNVRAIQARIERTGSPY